MALLTSPTLTGVRVRLEPLSLDHERGLIDAATDGELWTRWYTAVPTPGQMRETIKRQLVLRDEGNMIPFATRDLSTDRIIGSTTFMNIRADIPRVEIGSTWNSETAQGSGTNPESKLLLLTHAFETWGCSAVEFRTSWHNRQSKSAIEKLGAKLDGILRQDVRTSDGSLRDTCVYSVIAAEWPQVRSGLRYRLGLPLV